jgi:uroporphyrinogen decarboxylase
MTTLENIRACVRLQVPDQLPVFALSQEFDAAYCGLTYAQYIRDAQTVVETQLRVIEKFGWDWAWLHLDDTLEFEPLGVGVAAGENVVPATADYLPFDRKTLGGLKVPDPKKAARMPLLLDAIAGLRSARGDETCVTGRVAAPFSAVTLIFGMTESFFMMADNPKLFREALKFAEEQALAWGLAQIEAGAHAIWYGDCNASMHLISPGQYEEWALEPCRRVCQAFQEAGALVLLHNSEENLVGLRLQALTEPDILSTGPGIDRAVVADEFVGKICTIGNVDPIGLLQLGSASQVAAETDRQVRLMGRGGMILSSGECIPREAKAPNMHTMIDTAHKVWNLTQHHQ